MLILENITWRVPDGDQILNGVDLVIPSGGLTVITGPNGGGKTSLAKIVAGLIKADTGRILLDGEDLTELSITDRARKGVGYAFQQPVRFKGITVRDMLELAAGHPLSEKELCDILGSVGLCTHDYIDREVSTGLSGGEIKRIEIASVLARSDTKLCIFDEPEAGIDLWSFAGLIEAFQKLKNKNSASILIISHQERILNIADEIIVIADGKVKARGSRQEIMPTLLDDEKAAHCPRGKEVY